MEELIAYLMESANWGDVIVPVCSLITSIAAVFISVITYRSQITYNKNSVRPILNIIFGDYENVLRVKIVNNGVGPAIISDLKCTYTCDEKCVCRKSLVHLLPPGADLQIGDEIKFVNMTSVSDFVEDVSGRVIPPDGKIVLLEVRDPTKTERWVWRNFLQNCDIEVQYSDIYKSKPWKCKRSLDFFGRTLPRGLSVHYF